MLKSYIYVLKGLFKDTFLDNILELKINLLNITILLLNIEPLLPNKIN